ncbi:MAG: hypothetical protein WBN31_13805 [Gammaproteobacteria bacterium]
MNLLGFLLTAAGFLGGAFLTSLDPEQVRWGFFVPCMLVGAVGVYLIKTSSLKHARSDETLASNRADIEDSLTRVIAGLQDLAVKKDEIPPYELRFEIDRRFRDDLERFADARHSLTHIYGLQTYADIMSAFAAGERYLNRVWSASADGYVDEAHAYITRALDQFIAAKRDLDLAHAAAPVNA